ncbi:MAG: hypothetical protein R3B99_21355 [Polyangiales bacterium]
MRVWFATFVALSSFALGLSGCGGDTSTGTTEAVFTLPRDGTETFFSLPWPTDLRLNAEGYVDASAFPGVAANRVIEEYVELMATRVDGYSISAPTYFSFSAALDERTLPRDAEASLTDDASVFVVAIDPESPDYGTRHPVQMHYWDPQTRWWPGHALAVRPVFGIPLREQTTYAAVVTNRVLDTEGKRLRRSADFDALLGNGGDATVAAARAIYAPALTTLDTMGVSRDDVVSLAVFTTQTVTTPLLRARDWIDAQPAPEIVDAEWRNLRTNERYTMLAGAYRATSFQTGDIPFVSDGGEILFDAAGDPIPQETIELRFALSVPRQAPPAGGFPILIYAHGTGGDYLTFEREGLAEDLASIGIAVMGVDQIHHGPRNPTSTQTEILVFNFLNPLAFRDNARQSALDLVQQARAAEVLEVPAVLAGGSPMTFDTERMMFMGHSQGGLNGPIFLGIDDPVKAAVLSGAGGQLSIALVEKVEPVSIPELAAALLRVTSPESEHMVYEHPVHALLQVWTDVADPTHYVSRMFHEPREGFAPKHVLQTEGITDPYTPPLSMEALATAARIPHLGPELRAVPGLTVQGVAKGNTPARANASNGVTAGLLQFDGGHFVAFDTPNTARIVSFFQSYLRDGTPTIE